MTHTTQGSLQFRQLIRDHIQRVDRLLVNTGLVPNEDWTFIANADWTRFASDDQPPPCIAVVADNPGTKEQAEGVYLCRTGEAGSVARRFLDAVSGVQAVETGWAIVFNKSSFYTPLTKDLVSLMRNCNSLRQVLVDDQKENGLMVARTVAALRIPVLTVGIERSNAFDCFRGSLVSEARKLGILNGPSQLLDRTLPATLFFTPHFSHFAAFQKCRLPGWNERLAAFVNRNPNFATSHYNPSWSKIRNCQPMVLAYMFEVLLGYQP